MLKINYEKAHIYIDSIYNADELAKTKYIDSTELKTFGTVIASDVSRMMQMLLILKQPKRILEIGTSIGYSTVSMATVAKKWGGKITTIECEEKTAKQAIKNFENAGVSDLIEVKIGDARKIVPALKENFDLIFQDVGDKKLYADLLNDVVNLLNPGGIFMAEDSLLPAVNEDLLLAAANEEMEQLEYLKQFNQMVAKHPQLRSTIIPVGDGLTVGIKA